MSKQETKTKGMCIATRCTTVDQFIQMFHRFVDEDSFFVSTLNTRAPGLETSFSVQLADNTPVLRGLCVVMEAWTTPANPFKTPGVRLGIKRLTANSMAVFEQLLAARTAAKQAQPKPPRPPALAAIVVAKPGTPKPIVKSPFTETAPTKHAASRIELKQPARPSTDPNVPMIADAVPRQVAIETTDVTEEKTDVRDVRPLPVALPVPRPLAPMALARPKPIEVPKRLGVLTPVEAATTVDPPPARDSAPVIEVPAVPVAIAAAPSDVTAEPLDVVDVAKPLETSEPVRDDSRTPGSDLVLPANPLMNLTDESLEGYVDCTLYEETGNFFPADDDTAFDDDLVPPPRPVSEPVPLAAAPSPGETPAAGTARPDTDLAVPRLDTAPVAPPPPVVIAPRNRAAADPSLIARGSTPALPSDTADNAPQITIDSNSAISKLPLAPPDASGVTHATPAVMVPTRDHRKRWLLVGGAGVAVAGVALILVMISSSTGQTRTASPPVAKQAREVAPAIVTKPDKVAAPREEPVDEPGEPSHDGPPVVGSGPCKVIVHSTPAGSIVKLDDTRVGPTPLTVAASCGKHKVELTHARYAPTTKAITLTEGKPETLELNLSRPTHVVTVTSNPSGAQVFLDGRSAGTTPTKLSVLGFITLKLEFKKTGYQPTNAKFYSRNAQDQFSVKLTKW